MYANQGHLSAERPSGYDLSRSSSASSDRASPMRPPRSDRRRSSASPEPGFASLSGSQVSPSPASPPAVRSPPLSGLNVVTSSPLATIRAGSTPVSPRMASPPPLPSPKFSLNSFTPSNEMYRSTSSASSLSQSSSVPHSPGVASPLATFTAGMPHTHSPGIGPLKIESTTGSKATVIKAPKRRRKSRTSSRASSAYSGGISSEDVFGKGTDKNDSDAQSNTSSNRFSTGGRKKSISISSFGKKAKQPERGISSTDTFPPDIQDSRERSSPSLANMLQGLRRGDSASNSPLPSGMSSSSRSSSRMHSSGPSNVSESDSVALPSSSKLRRNSSGKGRLANAFRRKTSLEREEDEEQLRVLANLRLRALALASADDDNSRAPPGTSQQRENAELLIRGMQEVRTSAIPLNRQSSSASDSFSSSHQRASSVRSGSQAEIDLHIRSPSQASARSGDISPTHRFSPSIYSSDSEAAVITQHPRLASGGTAQAQEHLSDDELDNTAILAEGRRRSTLIPGSSSHSSLTGLDRPSASRSDEPVSTSQARRSSGGLWLTRDSFDGKNIPDVQDSGDEADLEVEVDSELLERRRSTIRPTQSSLPPILTGSGRSPTQSTKAQPLPSGPKENVPHIPHYSDEEGDASPTSVYAPPARTTSRPISPEGGAPVSPLKFRSGSYFSQPASPPPPVSPSESGDRTFTLGRHRETSVSSQHTREGAGALQVVGRAKTELDSPTRRGSGRIVDELNQAINAAMHGARRSSTSPKTDKSVIDLPDSYQTLPEVTGSVESANVSPKTSRAPSLASLRLHRRTSSDVPLSLNRRPSHHRRTSSGEYVPQVIAPPPMHRRTSSAASVRSIGRGRQASQPRLPSHAEYRMDLEVDQVHPLLVRNKPLPQAAMVREDIRRCRSSGERAIVYAQKINELALCHSGLDIWIEQVRQRGLTSPRQGSFAPSVRKASNATLTSPSFRPSSPPYMSSHATREDNMSEAPFPLRKGSQDVYRARDITQRTPSIAPSTMVPPTIPYPGVYDNNQTLRTTSALSHTTVPHRQQGSFASAALNAAGLPSRVGFFGLGRKGSKRAPSSNYPRHRAGNDSTANTNGLSISGPLQVPAGQLPSSVGRTNALRPSGPRPSISGSSSDMPSYASSSSIRSLASLQQFPAPSPQTLSVHNNPLPASSTYSKAVNTDQELLTSMTDILPLASRDVLASYLQMCQGDHLAAIGRYLDDERAGKV